MDVKIKKSLHFYTVCLKIIRYTSAIVKIWKSNKQNS